MVEVGSELRHRGDFDFVRNFVRNNWIGGGERVGELTASGDQQRLAAYSCGSRRQATALSEHGNRAHGQTHFAVIRSTVTGLYTVIGSISRL